MCHICSGDCDCKLKLDAAMAALTESSRLLSGFVFSGPSDKIEKCFVCLQRATFTLFEAIDEYAAHLKESRRDLA